MMMTHKTLPIAVASAFFATAGMVSVLPAGAANNAQGLSAQDSRFLNQAAQIGLSEVDEASIATARGDQGVRQFAMQMIHDHSANNAQIEQLAGQYSVHIPQEPDPVHQAQSDRLSTLYGGNFDRAYLRSQVQAHQQAIDVFQREANSGQNADLRSLAEQTLPILQDHLRMAQDLLSGNTANLGSTMRSLHRMDAASPTTLPNAAPGNVSPGAGTTAGARGAGVGPSSPMP